MSFDGLHRLRPLPPIPDPVTSFGPVRREPLDVSDPVTFERWCTTPEYDTRTLHEYAEDGGYPVGPPNRTVAEAFIRSPFPFFPPYAGLIETGFLRPSLPRAPVGGTGEKPPPPPRPPLKR